MPAGRIDPLLPLGGVPVLPMPAHVREAAAAALDEPDDRDPQGLNELRSAVSGYLLAQHRLSVDPAKELLVTHGAMHGLAVALAAMVGPGDDVLIPAPTFFFEGAVRLAGAAPVYVRSTEERGWRWDLEAIEAAVTSQTRVILICNPSNPTGCLPRPDELLGIVELARRHGLTVVSDESYERYAFDGLSYTPIARYLDEWPRLVTVTSLSKNYAFSLWRLGYVHAPKDLLEPVRRVFEWNAINCGIVPQKAAAAAITGPQEWVTDEIKTYQAKRDLLMAAVAETGVLTAVRPEAGVFALIDCSALGDSPDAIDQSLLRQGVPSVPGSYFRAPGSHVRLVFGAPEPVLEQLGTALSRAAADAR